MATSMYYNLTTLVPISRPNFLLLLMPTINRTLGEETGNMTNVDPKQ